MLEESVRLHVVLRVPRPLRGLLLDLRKTHTPTHLRALIALWLADIGA